MKTTIDPDMLEATRLTRAGQLTEATALLQRVLRGKEHDVRPAETRPAADALPCGEPRIIEITPEMMERPGRSWSFLGGWLRSDRGVGHAAAESAPTAQPMRPEEALRDFLARVGRIGATPDDFAPAGHSLELPPTVLPPGARFLTATYTNEAGTRAYKLYVPSAYTGQPLPLIVMLHGCTQSPDDFATGTRMNVVGEEHDCFVAYPAQSPTANRSKCWNWFNPGDQQRGQGEPSLIAGITRRIMREYAIDPKRVYIAGLSAGGAAAAVLGATYPDIFAAVGVHSGLACGAASDLPSAFAAMRQGSTEVSRKSARSYGPDGTRPPVPTIVFHGDKDVTVHPRNGAQVIEQSSSPGRLDLRATTEQGQVGGRTYSRTSHLDASGDAILEMWVVHGAGHAWSGGSSAGSFTDPHGPDASREMVRFFLGHPRMDARPN